MKVKRKQRPISPALGKKNKDFFSTSSTKKKFSSYNNNNFMPQNPTLQRIDSGHEVNSFGQKNNKSMILQSMLFILYLI